jgi:alpha-mannosidase
MTDKNGESQSLRKHTRRDILRLLAGAPALSLAAGSMTRQAATITPASAGVRQIIVVCKTHFDLGYSHRVKDLLAYYRTTMIDRALEVMEQAKELPPQQRFVWTSPGWVMQKVLEDWDGQTAERRQKLDAAMKSRQFVTHAMPFSIEAELVEPEEFARGYMFADAVSRQYGLPLAEGAKTTDVPSQSPSLATGLAHGGVKFMHIGCNWPSGYVHNMPPLFWWEGPDGSRVLTMYSTIYGTSTAFWPWGGKDDPYIGHNLLPPPNWPYKTWVAIIVTGDNSGPPGADGVKSIFAEAAEKLPDVDVRMGTM